MSEKEIIEFAKENLAGYKCPKKVIFEDKLPRNASGNLLKYQLRQLEKITIATVVSKLLSR